MALLAGVGFLLPIIVARSQGTVLRKALREGLHDFWQNCLLVVLLAIPGLAIEILSEYVVRWGTLSPRVLVNYPLANYARALENELPRFVVVASISAFVTIVLFASGSVFHYRNRRFAGSEQRTTEQPLPNLDSAPV